MLALLAAITFTAFTDAPLRPSAASMASTRVESKQRSPESAPCSLQKAQRRGPSVSRRHERCLSLAVGASLGPPQASASGSPWIAREDVPEPPRGARLARDPPSPSAQNLF